MKNSKIQLSAALLLIAAITLFVASCGNLGANVNQNGVANSNAGAVNDNSAENASGKVENSSVSETNSSDEKTGDEKLEQRIIGKWEGKNPKGDNIGLDFRADKQVFAYSGDKIEEKPATYTVIDEKNVDLTTPDAKPEIFKISVEGDIMTVNADTGKFELTKKEN